MKNFLSLALLVLLSTLPCRASEHLWKPAADTVFLQELNKTIATESPVSAVAVLDEVAYALMGGEIYRVNRDGLSKLEDAPTGITGLVALDGALWATGEKNTLRFTGGKWERVADQPLISFCMHQGAVHAATRADIFRFENGAFVNTKPQGGYLSSDSTLVMEDGSQVLADPVEIGPIDGIVSYLDTLYLLRPGGIALLEGPKFVPEPVDWGALPSPVTRDLLAQGSILYVATDRGVSVLRSMAMTTITGEQGLPYEEVTCLAPGFAEDLWIGTTSGAIRKVGDRFDYFGAQHWLPNERVTDIAAGKDRVYVATEGGLGIITFEPYTLEKKAAYFERALEEGGFKRLGFVHKLYWNGADKEWLREVSDNDGGHTSHYLAAMTFKYAATGDEQARAAAADAFKSMSWLQSITGTDGFFARAIWSVPADKGKRAERGSGGLPAKWYPTADGLWQWKGDTSSDEVNGHFFSVALFHDLAAQGEEKARAADHLVRIARHIQENGWVLRDMDGKPTRWGRWDPDYLLKPYGMDSRGLNGMEAQTYMWTAYKLSGDERFKQGLDQLIQWRYHTYTLRQKLTFPPDLVVPWDDELAFRVYHPLLTYADDPYLRSIYLRSLARHWEVMRMQKLPFYNYTYGALTGNDCETEQAAQHLREWSLDLVDHPFHNSQRADLKPEPGYVPYGGGTKAISPRNQEAMWGSRPATVLDGGNDRGMTPPIGWLEDYWMGRYYGFIQAPDTKLPLGEFRANDAGAKPYDGPPRP